MKKKWSEEEDNTLRNMMENGFRYKNISEKLNRSERAIRERSRKLNCLWTTNNITQKLEKTCKECGKIYIGSENDKQHVESIFCSRSCSVSFNNKKSKINHYCIECGKTLKRKHKYCSKNCQTTYEYKKYIESWKAGEKDGISGKDGTSQNIRKYLFEKYNNKCSKCGWNEINPYTGKIPLNIEHIDGNWMNNKEENLDLLCPNCHSLTPTYGCLNKGNGRKERRK